MKDIVGKEDFVGEPKMSEFKRNCHTFLYVGVHPVGFEMAAFNKEWYIFSNQREPCDLFAEVMKIQFP